MHLRSVKERIDISIRDIWEAKKRISSLVDKTPLIQSAILSEKLGRRVF